MIEDPEAFSAIADVYDGEYSSQLTIRLQRRIYWKYLDTYLSRRRLRILDMNCGTGTDAVHMIERYPAKQHDVTGIDISPKMIRQFTAKAEERGLADRMHGYCSSLQQLDDVAVEAFDLVTSNFGGLNCLSEHELRSLAATLRDRCTAPSAHLIAVVMPTFCLSETAYYLCKGSIKEAFRRQNKAGVSAQIGGAHIHTYYYAARRFAELVEGFTVEKLMPLGLFLPASFIDNFFRRHKMLARASACLENQLGSYSLGARLSDHFIIDLRRRD